MSRLFVDRISPYQSGSVQVDGLSLNTGSLATTGSNNFVGNQDISGQLTISSSAAYDIDVVGRLKVGNIANTGGNSAQVFVSASAYYSQVTPSTIESVRATGGGVKAALGFGGYISAYTSDYSEVALVADGASYSTGWSQGPAIGINNPADGYPAAIGFQNKSNWTDGRITFLKIGEFKDVIELAAQDPLPAGSVGQLSVSGSNLYYHNGSSWSQIN